MSAFLSDAWKGREWPATAATGLCLMLGVAGLISGGSWRWLVLPALLVAGLALLRARRFNIELTRQVEAAAQEGKDLLEFPTQVAFVCEPQGQMTRISPRWTEWTGMSLEDAYRGDWIRGVHEPDQAGLIAAWANALASGMDYDQHYRVRFRGGRLRWIRCRAFPRRHADGSIRHWVGILEDVHERRVAEEQLRQTATLLEMIGQSTESLLYAKDRQGRLLYANRALERAAGVNLAEILGKTDAEWNPNPVEAEACENADHRIMERGEGQAVEEMFTGQAGSTRYYRSLKSPLRDRSGAVIGVVGISTDVTEQREAEQREQLLLRELDHRAKNLLAVVQSVVALTRASDIDRFKSAVEGRIQALGRAHSMLAASRWEGADLQRVLAEELAPYRDDDHGRVHLSGPPLMLKPMAAQSLSLVIHELATNAAKYGALSQPGGRLDVEWQVASSERSPPTLRLTWKESGGPPVPPRDGRSRMGFGSRLIQNSIERQLGGTLDLDWSATGLTATMDVALERSMPQVVSTNATPTEARRRVAGRSARRTRRPSAA